MRTRALVAVTIGGLLGATGRWAIDEALPDADLAWSVLLVNAVGSALLGFVLAELLAESGPRLDVTLGVGTGFCGSFTTFSAWSVATAELLRDDRLAMATGWVAMSVGSAVLAAWLGARVRTARAGP